MLGFFRKLQAEKAAQKTELHTPQSYDIIEGVQSSPGNQGDLEVLRKRVAELTHKAIRGGLNETERTQIMHEADLLWTRLAVQTQQARQPEKVS